MPVVKGPWEEPDVRPSPPRPAPSAPEPESPRLPPKLPNEERWQWARRVARDVMHLPVPDEPEREAGPPRPRRVKSYEDRLDEIYRGGREREPGEEG